jgi:hypothetical protein
MVDTVAEGLKVALNGPSDQAFSKGMQVGNVFHRKEKRLQDLNKGDKFAIEVMRGKA